MQAKSQRQDEAHWVLKLWFMDGCFMLDILSWGTLLKFIKELRSKGRAYKNVLMSFYRRRLVHQIL